MSLRDEFGTDVLITGWGHTRFGRLDDESLESLVVTAAREALASAAVEPGQVDEIVLGHFNSGLWPLGFASSLALQVSDELANVPATRVENACASGSAAVQQGVKSLLAGTARTVLVIGAEKMTHALERGRRRRTARGGLRAGRVSRRRPVSPGSSPRWPEHYEKRHGPVGDTLGSIAAKNHRNGVLNPWAQLRRDLGTDFCRTVSDRNPLVADPLRRTDCSPVSDGAAALVLSTRPDRRARRPACASRASATRTTSCRHQA